MPWGACVCIAVAIRSVQLQGRGVQVQRGCSLRLPLLLQSFLKIILGRATFQFRLDTKK